MRQPQWVEVITVDALKFTTSRFGGHEVHGLAALWTRRGWRILGHDTHRHLGSACCLSPRNAQNVSATKPSCAWDRPESNRKYTSRSPEQGRLAVDTVDVAATRSLSRGLAASRAAGNGTMVIGNRRRILGVSQLLVSSSGGNGSPSTGDLSRKIEECMIAGRPGRPSLIPVKNIACPLAKQRK
jgi:hypothetical protein